MNGTAVVCWLLILGAVCLAAPGPHAASAQQPVIAVSDPAGPAPTERHGPGTRDGSDSVRDVGLQTRTGRPRIGLVLSGGGARGMAHVGVLQVLEELRVPVDFVVGTSAGALAGGLFAAGVSPGEMKAWLEHADWDELFRDQPSYTDLSYRRKREEEAFPIPLEVGVGPDGFQLPSGLVAGQKLNATLRTLTFPVAGIADFDSLAVPYRAVATDLSAGSLVIFDGGDLVDAMRASMTVPGAFTPYPVGDQLLVDGGLLLNLPVEIALDMDPDILIAVDVGSDLVPHPEGPAELIRQVTQIMMQSGDRNQRELLRPGDILIRPQLGDLGAARFDRSLEAVAAGEAAARGLANRLRALAMDSASYARRRDRRLTFGDPPDRVDFVTVGPYTDRSPTSILERIVVRPGPMDTVTINRDIAHLYSLGIYERVDYQIERLPEGTLLRLGVHEKPWGPAYLRFRMNVQDRLGGEGTYSLAANLLVPQLNSWGAEFVGNLEVGAVRGIRAELFQPLGIRGLFFVAPSFQFRTTPSDVYMGDFTVARFRNALGSLGLEAGMHVGNDIELAVRAEHGLLSADRTIGDPDISGFEANLGRFQLRAIYDGLDDPEIPHAGSVVVLLYEGERRWLGADVAYGRATAQLGHTFSVGRFTAFTMIMGTTSGRRPLPAYGKAGLGGVLLLSGYPPGAISGNHMMFGRAIVLRHFGNRRIYAGLSFEAGNAWDQRDDATLDSLLTSTTLALALRTPLGRIYLAYALTGGDNIAYLALGTSL